MGGEEGKLKLRLQTDGFFPHLTALRIEFKERAQSDEWQAVGEPKVEEAGVETREHQFIVTGAQINSAEQQEAVNQTDKEQQRVAKALLKEQRAQLKHLRQQLKQHNTDIKNLQLEHKKMAGDHK